MGVSMPELNEKVVKELPKPATGNKIHFFTGAMLQGVPAPAGFGVCVTANGSKAFILNYRHAGAYRRLTIGKWPTWSALLAVKEARELRRAIDRGEDPLGARRREEAAAEETFKAVAEEFFRRDGAGLRTKDWAEKGLERLAYPKIGDRNVAEIRRSDIVRLLDEVADERGRVMADRLLATIRRILNWHATRSDDYVSPIVRGMGKNAGCARQRALTDEEIRSIWLASGSFPPVYHAMIKFLLLTGARRSEASRMPRQELRADGVWLLPAARNKTKVDLARPLSAAATAALPPGTGPFVFTSPTGVKPIADFTDWKAMLDEASGVSDWTVHDLRRTARSLMSRAGVPTDHAERCLGHVIGGVRGVYDVWEYLPQKRDAYEALAGLIERIVNPASNVVSMRR
jgi:integrase